MCHPTSRWIGTVLACVAPLVQAQQPAAPPPARVDAWVLTAHLQVRMARSLTDTVGWYPVGTVVVRDIRSDGTERIELSRKPNTGWWDGTWLLSRGWAVLVTTSDTGVSVTILDPARQWYAIPDIHVPPAPPPDLPPPPLAAPPVAHVRDIEVTVDSIGPGPVLLGHRTTHYRQTHCATVQISLGLMPVDSLRTAGIVDLDVATDIPDAPRITGFGLERIAEFPGGPVLHNVPSGLALTSDLAPALRAAAAKYPHGVILRLEGRQAVGPWTQAVTLTTDRWERTRVDASLLTVPAGYTKRTEADLMRTYAEQQSQGIEVHLARANRKAYHTGVGSIIAGLVLQQNTKKGTTGRVIGNILIVLGWLGLAFPSSELP